MNERLIKWHLLEHACLALGIISMVLISYAVMPSLGMYYPAVIWHLLFSWIFLVTICGVVITLRKYPVLNGRYSVPAGITCGILAFLYIGKTYAPGIYIEEDLYLEIVPNLLTIIAVLSLTIALLVKKEWRWIRFGIFLISVLIFGWIYVRMVQVSPSPMIDVFTMLRDGAKHTLMGLNPYVTPAENPYRNYDTSDLNLRTITFEYPPISLIPSIAGIALFGDVRYMGVACIFFVGFSIWYLARKKNPHAAELLCILWLSQPRGPFIIEQAWIEPWILATLSSAILFLRHTKIIVGSALFGFFVSFKQPFVVTILQFVRLVHSKKALFSLLCAPALVALPFFLWGPKAFVDGAVLFMVRNSVTYDSLTFMTYLYREHYILFGNWWTPSVLILSALLTYLLPHGKRLTTLLLGMSFSFLTGFLFGYRGFMNYYYYVIGLMILSFALMIDEGEATTTS